MATTLTSQHLLTASPQSPLTPDNIEMSSLDSSSNDLQFSVAKLIRKDCNKVEDNLSCCSEDTVLSVGNEHPSSSATSSCDLGGVQQLSFKNIQNHLNAISAITNNIRPVSPTISERLSPANSSRSCTSSPSSFVSSNVVPSRFLNYRRQQPLASPPSGGDSSNPDNVTPDEGGGGNEPINNNNNNNNLKFSIDNILKADFGRRITEPLAIKKGHRLSNSKKLTSAVNSLTLNRRDNNKHTAATTTTPVDLTTSDNCKLTVPSTPASSLLDNKLSGASGSSLTVTSPISSNSSSGASSSSNSTGAGSQPMLWPAWVYCTRYSDRPSSGRSPRSRRPKKPATSPNGSSTVANGGSSGCGGGSNSNSTNGNSSAEEKRPRTAFSGAQLARLKHEFAENRYLTERRRQQLSAELGLNEAQIKIWFQNKRAKIKKASGHKNPLALQLMAQGLYNHSTVPLTREEEELQQQSNSQG